MSGHSLKEVRAMLEAAKAEEVAARRMTFGMPATRDKAEWVDANRKSPDQERPPVRAQVRGRIMFLANQRSSENVFAHKNLRVRHAFRTGVCPSKQ